ncbi:MAG: alpha/beta hydrolase [Armatimonadota bacterium]
MSEDEFTTDVPEHSDLEPAAYWDRRARGLGARDLALVGFSQGAMMALHVAPRRAEACAAVVGYSGLLIGAERLVREVRSRPKVLLVHGEADELIPAQALQRASEGLEAAGVPVESHVRPGLGHGIDAEGMALGGQFLSRAFAA